MSETRTKPTFDGYTGLAELQRTSAATTYRATRTNDDRPVLLRVLEPGSWSPEDRERCRHDLNVSSSLDSRSVASPYAMHERDGSLLLVLEDFGGVPLSELEAERELTIEEAVSLALMAAEALQTVHRRGIAHRAMHPANIICDLQAVKLKLASFGLSTALTRETPSSSSAMATGLDMRYMSPEQTGRMNRSVDYRTDFYSLGVVIYECLTGKPPFEGPDPLDLAYCHMAEEPAPPADLREDVPEPLSDIVLKLLAKPPEERYQSAHGLAVDLRECQRQLARTGTVERFRFGAEDVPDRLLIPEKLYGRQTQINELIEAFDRVSQGRAEVMLVAGYSGIGKSALVNEVHRPIVRQRGHFISGKFDQYQRHIPYSSVIQAFRELVRQLLTETEEQVRAWRRRLLDALGHNGQVIVDVIPEMELIVGHQRPVVKLPPTEAENRFIMVFRRCLSVLARREHPLVLFLDDLQWTDSASLKLIESLVTDPEAKHFLVLGAYRDNEVTATHPLRRALRDIQMTGANVSTITLQPLLLSHVARLLADTLRCEPADVRPLAELVLGKTGGNPFFLRQFLLHLYSEDALTLDVDAAKWHWDTEQIRAMETTDNVVELMAGRIRDLAPRTQETAKLAACIGNRFSLQVLSLALNEAPRVTAVNLWEALRCDVIMPLTGTWHGPELPEGADPARTELMFLHDRVQEAAYALIAEEERAAAHLKIGRLLLRNTPADQREEKLFDIVNQLNTGAELIESEKERGELAELNLEAARKAKAAAAFGPAREYARAGIAQLTEDRWHSRYDLALSLHVEAVETEYLNADFEEALRISEIVLSEARSLLDKVRVYELQVQFLITQNRMVEALDTARPVLDMIGYPVSEEPAALKLTEDLPALDEIGRLPLMTDPRQLAALQLLTIITGAAYQGKPELFAPIVLRITNLCLEKGVSPLAAYGFGVYGSLLCGPLGDPQTGEHAGRLSLRLQEHFHARELKCKVRMVYDSFVRHWHEHHRLTIEAYDETIQMGLETGDNVYASYCCIWSCGYLFLTGHPLEEVEQRQRHCADLMMRLRQENGLYPARIWRQLALNLLGLSEDPHRLEGESLSEHDTRHVEEMNVVLTVYFTHFARLILAYVFRQFPSALEHSRSAASLEESAIASMTEGGFTYYDSLARLAMYDRLEPAEQEAVLARVDSNLGRLRGWAVHGPMNYDSKVALVEAERARMAGDAAEAVTKYALATDLAAENGFPLEEAITAERAADFYMGLGNERLARVHLQDARAAYERWGAKGKTTALDRQWGEFLRPVSPLPASDAPHTGPRPGTEGRVGRLDAMTLLKASQALSGELELGGLLGKLVVLALENAGAQRGVLVLNRDDNPRIEAVATHDAAGTRVLQSLPLEGCHLVPEAIVRYVTRAGESVVLGDAAQDGMYGQDPYVVAHKSRSVLCMPIHYHDRVAAVLYLENELAADVFTEDRLAVLQVLLTQAAISLENAELYDSRTRAERALRESEERMKTVLDALPIGVLVVDGETRAVVDANPAATAMIGLSRDEITGSQSRRFVLPRQDGERPGAAGGRDAGHAEHVLVAGDGTEKPVLMTTRSVRIGAREHLIESFVDISESKRLEAELRQAQKMEAVGQLAGGVAHDFNNLLQAIRGYTDLAMQDLPRDGSAYADLAEACKAAERAATLVQQLLAFSRQKTIRQRHLDLVEVVGSLTKMLHRVIGEHIELTVTHASGLKTVFADRGQVEQILMNLCVNARDAMPDGGRITIETANAEIDTSYVEHHTWAREGQYILLAVSDTGQGMPPEVAERAFEPFFTTKEVGRGTGMGLATVYGIVKQHEGFIHIYSELNQGTTFRVYLPASEPGAIAEGSEERPEGPVRGGTETVLLAEDEVLVRNMAAQVLQKAGYRVLTATDGEEAIRVFQENADRIQLSLLDVIMPKKSGRAVFDAIKAIHPHAPVLFCSGYSHSTLGASSLPEEGCDLIQKPYNPSALLRRVRDLLDAAR